MSSGLPWISWRADATTSSADLLQSDGTVLAGRSLLRWGLHADLRRHAPTDVAGMVMLDAQPPEAYTQLPGWRTFYSMYTRGEALAPSLARLGIARIGYDIAPSGPPTEARAEQGAILSTAKYYRALHDELAQLRTPRTEAQPVTSFGDKPLIVVTAQQDAQDGWLPLQDKMALLSTNSIHQGLPNVSHSSLIEDQHDSGYASSAIIAVVHAVRSGAPLTP